MVVDNFIDYDYKWRFIGEGGGFAFCSICLSPVYLKGRKFVFKVKQLSIIMDCCTQALNPLLYCWNYLFFYACSHLLIEVRSQTFMFIQDTIYFITSILSFQCIHHFHAIVGCVKDEDTHACFVFHCQVPVLDEQQTIVIEQNGTTTEIVGTVETVSHLQHLVHHSPDTVASPGWDGTERLELSEDQLSSLRSGDVVEMEDQLYLVELTQDPSNPHKQVLSFLPVTTATVTQ